MRGLIALAFPLLLVALALLYYVDRAGPLPLQGSSAEWGGLIDRFVEGGAVEVAKLELKAGDRYLLSVEADGLVDIYVLDRRDYERMLGGFRVWGFANVSRAVVAVPSLMGGTYYVVVRGVEPGHVRVAVKKGNVDDATRALRSGGEVLRSNITAKFGGIYVSKVALFSPGTRLEASASGRIAVLWSDEYRRAESLGVERVVKEVCASQPARCGEGRLIYLNEDFFDDAYIVVVGRGEVTYATVATPLLLVKVGACS